jgi:hypothetical protein
VGRIIAIMESRNIGGLAEELSMAVGGNIIAFDNAIVHV